MGIDIGTEGVIAIVNKHRISLFIMFYYTIIATSQTNTI